MQELLPEDLPHHFHRRLQPSLYCSCPLLHPHFLLQLHLLLFLFHYSDLINPLHERCDTIHTDIRAGYLSETASKSNPRKCLHINFICVLATRFRVFRVGLFAHADNLVLKLCAVFRPWGITTIQLHRIRFHDSDVVSRGYNKMCTIWTADTQYKRKKKNTTL